MHVYIMCKCVIWLEGACSVYQFIDSLVRRVASGKGRPKKKRRANVQLGMIDRFGYDVHTF